MDDFSTVPASQVADASTSTSKARPSRTAPKTAEQLLAETEKRVHLLRSKVLANRDRQRMALVEDLYRKYSVEPVTSDLSERTRLATLRSKLGL